MNHGREMRKYRPSNGTEGEYFMEAHCHQCIHERWIHHPDTTGDDGKCQIINLTMGYGVNDPEYPSEWIYDAKGQPTCTKWVKFDWGTDDDPRDPGPPPDPEDPMQLMMPFDITELFPFGEVVVTKTAIVEAAWLKELQHAEK